jgi:Ca-activated chloride channel family protein
MKFANIQMLFLIWAVPLLFLIFFYGMKRRQKILSRFSSARGLKSIVLGASPNRRWIKAALILCSLCFISLALSGPQYGYKWQEIERKGIDIIIAIDCSRSMLATDIKPTRLDRAKREVYDLLTMLQGDRAGLVAFAGTAFLQCPLTIDYQAFNLFLNSLSPDFLPLGGTDISGALLTALDGFDRKVNSEKAVILITDGENTGDEDPIEAAEEAKKADVKVFCIGVGSGEGVPIPDEQGSFKKDTSGSIILTKLDEDTLKKMAVITGGTYVRSVAGDMDLDAIYTKEIRGKMEAATLESGRKQIWEDRYQWLLAFAIIALIAELFLPSAKRTASVLGLLFLMIVNPPAYAGPAQEGFEAYKNGDYENALKLFIGAQLDDPDNPHILYNIGNAYYKTGEFDLAAKNFEQVLKTEDNSLKQKTFYNLGNANYKKGNLEDAIKNYEAALELDRNDSQAKQNLEFVKKVMAQKKEEQKNQQGENKKDGDSEEKDQPGDEKNQSGDQEDEKDKSGDQKEGEKEEQSAKKDDKDGKDQPAQNYGKEMDENQQKEKPAPGEENKEGEENAGLAKSDPSQDSENPEDKKQAERMLNRLKDQPGKAMIPFYGKQKVEKDW